MTKQFERAVVLGAGVMGVQIAALLACAGVRVGLLDLPLEGNVTARARRGIEAACKSRNPVFYTSEMVASVKPGGLDDLDCVEQADWSIEAVVLWKKQRQKSITGPTRTLFARGTVHQQ